MNTVLFISGHPDDHMTGAGFLNKLRKKGYELFEVVLTGGSGGYANPEDKDKIVDIREKEFSEASNLIGMKKTYLLNYDEHCLLMNKDNVEALVKIIREVNPNIIIIPNRDDYHETHLETNRIATKSIRTAMKERKLEFGKPVSPLMVLEWEHSVPKQPDLIVDITDEWPLKEKLLEVYKSQLNDVEVQKTKSLNQYRGAMIGVKYAEAFKTNRFLPLRIDKILGLI
ncbi:PIG-L family deacetylase [Candidatus Woesearchaeota archaeon]|nr:PIG-L family deacetylase [Candidatus Woesearchaeota archaeon]